LLEVEVEVEERPLVVAEEAEEHLEVVAAVQAAVQVRTLVVVKTQAEVEVEERIGQVYRRVVPEAEVHLVLVVRMEVVVHVAQLVVVSIMARVAVVEEAHTAHLAHLAPVVKAIQREGALAQSSVPTTATEEPEGRIELAVVLHPIIQVKTVNQVLCAYGTKETVHLLY